MESLQRNFLWGKVDGVFKHSLINWKSVCSPIESGGLGIRNLKLHNEALLGKWLWSFSQNHNRIWKKLIVTKYGEDLGGWTSSAVGVKNNGLSIWKGIRCNWQKYSSCTTWKIGRGDRVLFWKHKWLNAGYLSELFPEIFDVAVNKDAYVKDYCAGVGRQCTWTILLRRNLNDWEVGGYFSLMELLHDVHLEEADDAMVWSVSNNQSFSVKSFYSNLCGVTRDFFPWHKFWKSAAPTRVLFFAWCATRGKILTLDNLKHRGYSIVNRCILCGLQEESIAHLFLHCHRITDVWGLILSCFGVHMCFPNNLSDFLLAWWGQPLRKNVKIVWNLVPFCVLWLTWKERNRRTFEDESRQLVKIKSYFLSCLYSWAKDGREIDLFSFISFLDQSH